LFTTGGTEDVERPPLHIGLLFDTSGSMAADLAMARTAAVKFCNMLQRAEDVTLVDFDTEVRVARFGQADFPRFVERLRNRKPDGWTALYDALGVYLDGTSLQSGEKVLVAYTDGGDTRSVMSYSDALTALKASDVTVYVVGFLENQGARDKLEQRMKLTQIAEATGGLAFFPATKKDIDVAYAQVHADVNSRYLLGYVSSNQANDGQWRKLDVRLNRADLKTAKIRTRKGYFALMRPDTVAARPE
jgi:Ca-activated chloride channel family protein